MTVLRTCLWLSTAMAMTVTGGCAAPSSPPPIDSAAVAKLTQSCALLPYVDRARLSSRPDWSWVEPLRRRTRGDVADPSGDVMLRTAIRAAGIGAPLWDVSATAVRRPNGRWFVSYARYLAVPPPPQPPAAANATSRVPSGPLLQNGIFREGLLTLEAGRTIDAALASDCLARQPAVEPAHLPLKGMNDRYCPPDAGGLYALEILEGGRSRRFVHECSRQFASGLIIATIDDWHALEGAS